MERGVFAGGVVRAQATEKRVGVNWYTNQGIKEFGRKKVCWELNGLMTFEIFKDTFWQSAWGEVICSRKVNVTKCCEYLRRCGRC